MRTHASNFGRRVARFAIVGTIVVLLTGCLFGDAIAHQFGGVVGVAASAIVEASHLPDGKWIMALSMFGTFLSLILLQYSHFDKYSLRFANRHLWLLCALVGGGLSYCADHYFAADTTEFLVLLAGCVVGQWTGVWKKLCTDKNRGFGHAQFLGVGILLSLLAVAVFWPSVVARAPAVYRGVLRWSGPWDNPNEYGLLMGVGVILAVGTFVIGIQHRKMRAVAAVAALVGAGMVFDVAKSYSRGAMLATWVGGIVLALDLENQQSYLFRRVFRYFPSLAVIGVAGATLLYLQFQSADWIALQRLFSIVNENDFSCRNRVTAWIASFQIVSDYPVSGCGWGTASEMYMNLYCPFSVEDGRAINVNSYLVVATNIGIVPSACLVIYAVLALRRRSALCDLKQCRSAPEGNITASTETRLRSKSENVGGLCGESCIQMNAKDAAIHAFQAVCRASCIVLLLGFWFDGGLFDLPTSSVFWFLLELGRTNDSDIQYQTFST